MTGPQTPDGLCLWLAKSRESQRTKLAALFAHHVAQVSAMSDRDHARVLREIRKRLDSPELRSEVAQLLSLLARA